jgi:hypothetical protein
MERYSPEIKKYFRDLATKGGKKRMESLTAEERKKLARKAGKASGRARRKK